MMLAGGGKNSLQGIPTDNEGKFYFSGLDFYGTHKLTLTSKNTNNEALGWILMDSLYIPIKVPVYKQFETDSITPQIVSDISNIKRKRKYSLKDTIELPEVVIKKKRSDVLIDNTGEAGFIVFDREFEVKPEDTSYFNFDLYLYNLAPDLLPPIDPENGQLKSPQYLLCFRNDYFTMQEKGISYNLFYKDSILPEQLPISKMDRIVVLRKLGMKNDFFYVCIYPKPGVSLKRPEFYKLEERITGYYQARAFYIPHNLSFQESNSDLRPTLYWKPDILVTNHPYPVSFYSGKVTGNFKILVQGITNNGKVIYSERDYKGNR
jgi:hypothetical protein